MTQDIGDYKTESWTVSKSVSDALWVLSARIDKHEVPTFFEQIQATANDQNGTPHTHFVGIIPTADIQIANAADKATVTGYDYGWYLTVQYVPTDERITDIDTNPSDTITTLLGGTAWASVAGTEPYRINTVAEWADIKKSFEFGDRCTRWQAIQEICDYCNFVFAVKWRDMAGTWRPSAYFVHEDDIDNGVSGLDIPAEITITNPDAQLVSGVSVKDSPEHQYNRVRVTGFDPDTSTHFYATAQTAAVTGGTEIPVEYVFADAALTTQEKTDMRAQELLDFFQASAKVYTAKLMQRMDLELYQRITFSGYQKIEHETMRITRITYSRSATNVVEIEFSKDQAIQQLRRLERAVNPDNVSGTLDMVNAGMSDVGLIDVFDAPLADGIAEEILWGVDGAYVQLKSPAPLNLQGWSLDEVGGVRGPSRRDMSFWGYDTENMLSVEFARWKTHTLGEHKSSYLEIERDLYINNNAMFPRIYFDVDPFRPIYIQGVRTSTQSGLSITVGDYAMMGFANYVGGYDFIGCYADVWMREDLVMWGRIEGTGNDDLVFWDKKTGEKTLSQLFAGGSGGNADTVDGWNVHQMWGGTKTITTGSAYEWWFTFPYVFTSLTIIPTINMSSDRGWHWNIGVYVNQDSPGEHGIKIIMFNNSGKTLDMTLEAIAIWE